MTTWWHRWWTLWRIGRAWSAMPSLRLGQIVAVAALRQDEACPSVFYVRDADLVAKIQNIR